MGVMDAKAAAKILDTTPSEVMIQVNGITNAARHGYIDRVVNGADTRKYLIAGYEMLYTKKMDEAYRKHATK
jgi:acetyl-CoA carboxylase carboxyltransferase component